jgi:ketosteroid isomerase-like protein
LGCAALVGCGSAPMPPDLGIAREQVAGVERAFAQTMADRDFTAFARFIADDAVFLNDGKPLRGKPAVLAHWKRFFEGSKAPFAWRPEFVEVLETGSLAQTTGPVFGADGAHIANFYSTWRRDTSGTSRIVLDNGYAACRCTKP